MGEQQIAQEILRQLTGVPGTKRLSIMTGASNFTINSGSDQTDHVSGLMFMLPMGEAKNKATKVMINLMRDDTYTVKFMRKPRGKFELVEVSTIDNVYAESLRNIFESQTGLCTKI